MLVLGTHVELIPLATAACPQAICRGPLSLLKPCKTAMVPRSLAKQNHSWQKTKQKIAPKDKNTVEEKFKEGKHMKIIIGQFQTVFGWFKRKQDKVQEGKSKGSQRVSATLITRREMSQGINTLNLITIWSQDEVGKMVLSFL